MLREVKIDYDRLADAMADGQIGFVRDEDGKLMIVRPVGLDMGKSGRALLQRLEWWRQRLRQEDCG